MPTYSILCPECGRKDDIFDSYKNMSLYRCMSCGSSVSIQPSAAAVHFKAGVGEVRRAELKVTDEDGKTTVRRMPELETQHGNKKI